MPTSSMKNQAGRCPPLVRIFSDHFVKSDSLLLSSCPHRVVNHNYFCGNKCTFIYLFYLIRVSENLPRQPMGGRVTYCRPCRDWPKEKQWKIKRLSEGFAEYICFRIGNIFELLDRYRLTLPVGGFRNLSNYHDCPFNGEKHLPSSSGRQTICPPAVC